MSIEFSPLPPVRSGNSERLNWQEITAALKDRPGEWAIIRRLPLDKARPNSTAKYVRETYGLEARVRTIDDEYRIYARWPENDNPDGR